jgi:hypothetical protein
VRGLFERELLLLRANTDDDADQWDEWENVHAELHEPGIRLQSPDKSYAADEILIHIDGKEAWWRNALERTVRHGRPRLAAARSLWPAAQLGR